MSNGIKAGDLVIVVRPSRCCSNTKTLGLTFVALDVVHAPAYCCYCDRGGIFTQAVISGFDAIDIDRLKKIDPPADGASLPMREDVGVAA